MLQQTLKVKILISLLLWMILSDALCQNRTISFPNNDISSRTLYYESSNGKIIKDIYLIVGEQAKVIENKYENNQGIAVFEKTIQEIGGLCDWRTKTLSSITIPQTVEKVNWFHGFDQLKTFKGKFASEDGKCLIVNDTLKSVAYGFKGYDLNGNRNSSQLVDINIPEGVKVIDEFCQCRVNSLKLPQSLVSIKRSALNYVSSRYLRGKYATKDQLAMIINGEIIAFAKDNNLIDSYRIPNIVHTIGSWVFDYSVNIERIYIPSSVKRIKNYAFANRGGKLKYIICEATTPPIIKEDEPFNSPQPITKIYVPASAIEEYKRSTGWKDYADRIIAE